MLVVVVCSQRQGAPLSAAYILPVLQANDIILFDNINITNIYYYIAVGATDSVYCALSLFFQHTLDDITKAIFVACQVRCYNFNADMLCQGKVETG